MIGFGLRGTLICKQKSRNSYKDCQFGSFKLTNFLHGCFEGMECPTR